MKLMRPAESSPVSDTVQSHIRPWKQSHCPASTPVRQNWRL